MNLLLSVFVSLSTGTVMEWWMHRYRMHKPGNPYYKPHAIEHHTEGMNNRNHMGFNGMQFVQVWFASLIFNGPLCFLLGWTHLTVWTIFQAWWFFSWEYVHRAIHDEPEYAWARWLVPWFRWSKANHLAHHKDVRTKFAATFPWADYLFGTWKRRSRS